MTESEIARSINPVNIEDEMKQSYMEYAMSVIVGRALPDVRDGLKPVHRRVLYAMNIMGNDWNKAYKKSARIVGDVIGKYHPHGDTAVYDTMVRMAQPFSLRYVLVDGQGNFGSVDGDSPAAMRYTEVRMTRITHELLEDLDKDTVDFIPNYDGSEHEPTVLPARIPNLLVNGSSGIAVGMATNIPPHNLTEVIGATIALMDNGEMTTTELMQFIPGPDFPTAGFINGSKGIREAYETGRGKIYMRARVHVGSDDEKGRHSIIVTELPYQVNKARLMEKIAELVKDKKISGIKELRDESDKDGMRMVIDLRKGEVPEVLINNLYQQTQMQNVFGINIVALKDGQPQTLNLKQLLVAFIRHRREIVTRRTRYDLRKSRARAHILEGLAVSLANIDPIITLIKGSPTPAEAKQALLGSVWGSGIVVKMLERADSDASRPQDLPDGLGLVEGGYRLSEIQAQAILDLKLQRLTGLEQEKIVKEYGEVLEAIIDLLDILSRPERLMQVIREELVEIRGRYGDERRTEILEDQLDLSTEDLITEEDVIVTLSHAGYAKSQAIDTYRSQRRGGRGKAAMNMKDEDFIDKLFIASTHDTLLCFSSKGKLYWLKVYQLPQASRVARGQPIVNLLQLGEDERINAVLPIREFVEDKFIFMATADGTVKKCRLTAFSRPRLTGLRAIELVDGDQLIGVEVTDGNHDIMLFSNAGKAVRFNETAVRATGRTAKGVRGIRLAEGQKINSLIIVESDESSVLTVTENGFGKRTTITDYVAKGRGGVGVISIQTTVRNGRVVGAVTVDEDDEIMLISNKGTLIRTPVNDVSVVGRNTQGVTLVKLGEEECLVSLERIVEYKDLEDASRDEAVIEEVSEDSKQQTMKQQVNTLKSVDCEENCARPVYNFGAGPAMLPREIMQRARAEFLDWHGTGISVMEMGHRSDEFMSIAIQTEADLREVLLIPDNYKVLFLQGGASSQFAMVPLNLLAGKKSTDYFQTGTWSKKALREAERFCRVNIISDKYKSIPDVETWSLDADAAYVYYTDNETISGVEFPDIPDVGNVPLVSDMTSNLLSKPLDVSRYGVIFAGAQKNIGPSGLVIVIVRDDLTGHAPKHIPSMYDYAIQAINGSMYNTPPTYSWYMSGLALKWIKEQGGLEAMDKMRHRRSDSLYRMIDGSDFYKNAIEAKYRSKMNVPFTLNDDSLNEKFVSEARDHGLLALEGHRSVGGMRASMYNAMPEEGVDALITFMKEFERING